MICKNLFTPGKIGTMELKNRIILPAMGSEMTVNGGEPSQRLIDYHVARAKGGCGLNIVEVAAIHPTTKNPLDLAIDEDRYIPALTRLTDAIRQAGGKSCIQIWHGGRVVRNPVKGYDVVSPSVVITPFNKIKPPRELTIDEIYELIEAYGDACLRAKKAGFDSVELHGAHGYLLAQFVSPDCNRRNDEFGGTFEKRIKFPIEVIRNVRKKVGPDYPVIYRVSGSEFYEGGLTNEDICKFVSVIEKEGVDAFHVSAGASKTLNYVIPPIDLPRGFNVENANNVKKCVSIPVIAVGRINDPIFAEKILDEGKADFIGIGRGQLADPEFSNKARANKLDEIVKCVGCNQGCLDMFMNPNEDVSCLRNPSCSREIEYELKETENKKNVLVIGAGPGGLESARVLSLRGHNVTLCDKSNILGGQFYIAGMAPRKEEIRDASQHMAHRVEKLGVKILRNTEVTKDLVKEINPDEVIVATGANQLIPNIPGINNKNVIGAWDLLKGNHHTGKNVVVIGGGLVGMEACELLAEQDKNVTVVEMLPNVGNGLGITRQMCVAQSIHKLGVNQMTNTKCLKIEDDKVYVERNEAEEVIENVDTVVVAIGSRSNNQLAEDLKDLDIPVHVIGDAVKPRRALDAIWEAAKLSRTI